ncbi:MAG: nickel pincer cofactor biosynthesis protein LarB [Gammaproteobacteria bacterium]|jgi:pyridinium-3,5-biscarboxylic acid mononucleotide synthase|nr:nickel pincer cofactor biosynthesis protein LarB [Gammaproteobacteria bacterium]MCH1551291.1 nickel pincer cofactor biosynthesis protein LarB [Pseudomonadales bacterium]
MAIEDLLNQYKSGTLDLADALTGIRAHYFEDIGHTIIDHDRKRRTGAGEVIFGEGKSADQIADIISSLQAKNSNILVTRLHPDKYAALTDLPQNASYHSNAQLLSWHAQPPQSPSTSIAVVTAGTSDINVAEEAALTAEFFGNPVTRIFDVGVAGLHRLLSRLDDLREARVLIVVAGMEGALPSVIGGLVDKPVIAVPTSVGYGAAFDGVAALLGMLTSCASGVSVVNIDNGFGAGFLANTINRL